MEVPLTVLRREQIKATKRLVPMLLTARQRLERKIGTKKVQDAVAINDKALSALGNQIKEIYEDLDQELDRWGHDLSDSTLSSFYQDTKQRLPWGQKEASVTAFSRRHAEDVHRIIHPGNRKHLAGVHTKKMSDSDIAILRATVVKERRLASLTGLTGRDLQLAIQGGVESAFNRLAETGTPSWQFIDKGGRRWVTGNYFNMLTRTTTQLVANTTVDTTLTEEGFDLVTIRGGADPCPFCARWRGIIVSIDGRDQRFPSVQDAINAGVFHPNCYHPDQKVYAPGVLGATRANYSGKMIRVKTSSGASLTVTPQHPILTPNGFKPAGSLSYGDELLGARCSEGMSFVNPNIDREQARIEDVFMSLQKAPGMSTSRMEVAPIYFHGDGQAMDGKIDIIGADGFLLEEINSFGIEDFSKAYLSAPDMELPFFDSIGPLNSLLYWSAFASNRLMGSPGASSPQAWISDIGESDLLSNAFYPNAVIGKPFSDSPSINSKMLTEREEAFSGVISTDKVSNIEVFDYVGHVYDLQTIPTLYYADGILSSNCVCERVYVDEDIDAEAIAEQAGIPNPKKPSKEELNHYADRIQGKDGKQGVLKVTDAQKTDIELDAELELANITGDQGKIKTIQGVPKKEQKKNPPVPKTLEEKRAQRVFKPAETKGEVRTRLKEFAHEVNLTKALTLDEANEILDSAEDILRPQGIKMERIGFATVSSYKGVHNRWRKWDSKTKSHYIVKDEVKFRRQEDWKKKKRSDLRKERDGYAKWWEGKGNSQNADLMRKSPYFATSDVHGIRGTAVHEFGHAVYYRKAEGFAKPGLGSAKFADEWREVATGISMDRRLKISEYAMTGGSDELFAEAYAHFKIGEKVPKEISNFIKKWEI